MPLPTGPEPVRSRAEVNEERERAGVPSVEQSFASHIEPSHDQSERDRAFDTCIISVAERGNNGKLNRRVCEVSPEPLGGRGLFIVNYIKALAVRAAERDTSKLQSPTADAYVRLEFCASKTTGARRFFLRERGLTLPRDIQEELRECALNIIEITK